MRNLLSANFLRLRKSKIFWGLLSVLFGLGVLFTLHRVNEQQQWGAHFYLTVDLFTYALFLYRAEVTVLRVFLAKLATNVQNVFLGGLGTYLWSSGGKGYGVIVAGSAVKNAIMLPVQTVMLAALFAALLPILHRMGFLPDQASRLKLWKRPGWLKKHVNDTRL